VEGHPFKIKVDKIKNDHYYLSTDKGNHLAQIKVCEDGYLEMLAGWASSWNSLFQLMKRKWACKS